MSTTSPDNVNPNVSGWYELGLPPKERKQRGHFSTPPRLVGQILDACGYTSQADLKSVRVLDPACGSGNFLAEAARRLLVFGARTNLDQEAQATLIQHNLWGFDPDPIACFLAEMQLHAILNERRTDATLDGPATAVGADSSCPPPIYRPEQTDATLNGPATAVGADSSCPPPIYRPGGPRAGLNIHQADALTLPWEPHIDLFVANPPYLAAKNADLSGYQSAQQRGQADSYLLFLNIALQALRPGGWMGLVLPDPLLARANAAQERAHLLKEATIHHLWHLSGLFPAEVGAVVIIAQKYPPQPMHQISWQRGKWQHAPSCGSQIPQPLLCRQPAAEFRYLLSTAHGAAIEQLRAHLDETSPLPRRLAPLSNFLTISRGEELGRKSPYLTSYHGRGDHVLDKSALYRSPCRHGRPDNDDRPENDDRSCYPILLGGIDIHPYAIPTAAHCIAREAVAKPLERYLSPKLLVVKSTDRLQAALDLQGHVALQTLYLLHPRTAGISEDDLYFFLALLNSRLLREYVHVMHTAYKWVQPQIEQSVLAHLPIPLVEADERQHIIKLARLLTDACSAANPVVEWQQDIHSMYKEQERAICALYGAALPGLFAR